jgi:predicted HicB family RNase H-like nuclease
LYIALYLEMELEVAEERKMMVRISEDLHRAVRVKAADLGRPVSEIVRGLLKQWVEGKVETPSEEEGRLEVG